MWYGAALLFQSVHNNCPTPDDVWQLQIIVIQAPSEDSATRIANEVGNQREHEYTSATGDLVRWVFRQIESLTELPGDIEHGTEIYARFLRANDVERLLAPIDTDDVRSPAGNSPATRPGPATG
jgi:hypothetical protein